MNSKTKITAWKEEATPTLAPKLRFPEFRGAQNWRKTTVGSISDTVRAGGTPSTSEKRFWGGEIRWMNSGELNDKKVSEVQGRITREGVNNSSTRVIPPRCVLIGLAGQGKTRGTVAMNLIELCINQSIAAIFPNDSAFNTDFLYHDLDKRYDELRRLSAGGEGRGGLNLQIIKSLKVALPSLPEQQKIAECLSSVDELMAAQARKVDALKTHKKGLMQQLFPREGETQPRLRFPEFQNAGEWESKTLKDIAKITSGSTPLRSNLDFFAGGKIPWVKTTDLNNSFIITTEEKITPKAKARVNPAGSVLVAMYGGFNQIGRTGCLSFPAATNQAISVLVLNRMAALPVYVLAWLNAKVEDWKRIASSSRKDPNITGSDVASFSIVLPGVPEQQRIATCLTSLDALITAETQKHEALKTHKRGLMQQLFPSPIP